MYKAVNKADYFLTLLDPENPAHNRYVKFGTSGSFQLIYGFNIPCLIAEKFAEVYSFTDKNSIVYKDNEDITEAMLAAINYDDASYQKMKKELQKLSDGIYQSSLDNLQKALVADIQKSSTVFMPRVFFLYYFMMVLLGRIKKKKMQGHNEPKKKFSLKNFFYHEDRLPKCIKIYICGIKVKRLKIKVDEPQKDCPQSGSIPTKQKSFKDKLYAIWTYPVCIKEEYDYLKAEDKIWKLCHKKM